MRTIDSVEGEADRRRLLDLARVFDHLPTGFCVFDAELRYVYVNGALAALSGLPPEDHIGRTFHEMLPRVAQSVETELRQVLTTGKVFFRWSGRS